MKYRSEEEVEKQMQLMEAIASAMKETLKEYLGKEINCCFGSTIPIIYFYKSGSKKDTLICKLNLRLNITDSNLSNLLGNAFPNFSDSR